MENITTKVENHKISHHLNCVIYIAVQNGKNLDAKIELMGGATIKGIHRNTFIKKLKALIKEYQIK